MKYPLLLAAAFSLFACRENRSASTDAAQSKESAKKPEKHFPVADFLKSEISYVDSLPAGIRRSRSSPLIQDTTWIERDEFHKLAAAFLPPEMEEGSFEAQFEETSFYDKGTETSTFFYSAENDSLPLRRVDVVTASGDVYDEVKSIYLQKVYNHGDTTIIKKLYWNPKRSFQIITQSSAGAQEPETELVKVVWDNRE